ncbi:MAG: DEAD/DEAH box helicase family protein [Candidatus Pacebacteria bacterium]|jgi:type III restriction enzyme|nr:DEAD/DEAH box helicase family protein [Candidatus Paceibacterota bacterium]
MFNPLSFQQDTVEKLLTTLTDLWKKDGGQLPLVFKSPTGSGKTFMLAHFVRGLNKLPNWDVDKAFVWITFSDDLAVQSKKKFEEYFENTLENNLLTVNDINRGKMFKNDILFLNWQKVVSRAAENRVLRRPNDELMRKESGKYFEDFIDGTKKDSRSIILIIDEAHTNVTPDLAQQIIDYIDPKIVIHVSATPKPEIVAKAADLSSYVVVDRRRVVAEGLIKEKIVTQTEEDLKKIKGKDLDEALLDLGMEKREQLKSEFEALGKKINPLLLIQLPNDDNERIQRGEKTKEQITSDYLKKRGIKENKIARWFDNFPKPDGIEDNEDDYDVLIFKLAAGTGWDCPRAHILVMFRNVRVEQRYIQTVGRILRMPEPDNKEDYKNNPNLRVGYLYTNYNRKDITENWVDKTQNKPFVHISKRKKGINNIKIQSAYVSRVDYGDLSNSAKFQMSFIKSMNNYFGLNNKDDILGKTEKKILKKGIDLDASLKNQIVVDAQFEDYDRINFEFRRKGYDVSMEMSQNDVEKTFNYLCWQLLKEQTEDTARITNLARSWSPLKSAIRVWLKNVLGENNDYYYRVFIKDIQKGASSVFRPAITQSLKDYRPILEKILNERAKRNEEREAPIFTIQESYSYTEDYAKMPMDLYVLEDFYIRKDNYDGKPNETKFINYLDNKKKYLEWWFKQGIGQEYFAVKYFNTADKKDALFYPDWILKFKDGRVGIFDTKSGRTATDTEGRAPALVQRLKELGKKYIGGIVIKENAIWYYSDAENYKYTPGNLDKNWKKFEDLL